MFAVLMVASAAVAEETAETASAESAGKDAAAQSEKAAPKATFTTLPLCRLVEGEAYARSVGASEWSVAEEGRFYPLGTSFRTAGDGRLIVFFGPESSATISGEAEFATRAQALGERSRTVVLMRGTVELKLADNLPDGAFCVSAPGFVVKNLAGESRYVYEDKGDGDRVTVTCKTGKLGVSGRHFEIPAMHPADEVVIRTSHDQLSTFLYGTSGDYAVKLDKDVRVKEEIGDDGQTKQSTERQFAEFRLSPATKVIINRSVSAVGGRMSAFITAYDAAGERMGEGIRVCEGRSEINAGELVDKAKLGGEELAKRAAEATETTTDAEAEKASSGEENSEEKASENKKEEKEEE